MTPVQRRGETFEALRRLLVRRRRAAAAGAGDRGPALDRRRERAVPGRPGRQRPALRVLLVFTYRPGYAQPVRGAQLRDAHRAGDAVRRGQRAHGRGRARCRIPARRAARPGRREGRGQPLLRRGARQVARGERRAAPGGGAARADRVAERGHRARTHPGRHRCAHRPPRRGAQADAPARLGDRARVHPPPGRPARRDPRGRPRRACAS